ncbi:Glutaminyl-peptide cyclotransferase [Diplonema papillatum]|nr:Glutaminyl-peptide cyclotransferase [Diplonema papillatum]
MRAKGKKKAKPVPSRGFATRAMVPVLLFAAVVCLGALAASIHNQSPSPAVKQPLPRKPTDARDLKSSAEYPNVKGLKGFVPYTLTPTGSFPHDETCFTQGLLYKDGYLYESAGLYDKSDIRRVDAATGEVLQKVPMGKEYFGEGLTEVVLDGRPEFWQLTWHEKVIVAYEATPEMRYIRTMKNLPRTTTGELWGICNNGTHLFVTDGSEKLEVWSIAEEPKRVAVLTVLEETPQGERKPRKRLNELECLPPASPDQGWTDLLLNVWYSDEILRVSGTTGAVLERFDLSGIYKRTSQHDVLNGIAYDAATQALYITGKLWSKMYTYKLSHATD